MKNLLIGLLLFGSLVTLADTTVKGEATLKQYSTIQNTSFVTISGAAANKIWEDMVLVNISPASQFQPNDMKIGDGINCSRTISKETECYILLDSSEGKIKH